MTSDELKAKLELLGCGVEPTVVYNNVFRCYSVIRGEVRYPYRHGRPLRFITAAGEEYQVIHEAYIARNWVVLDWQEFIDAILDANGPQNTYIWG